MELSPRYLVKLCALCAGISILSSCSDFFEKEPEIVVQTQVTEVNIPLANRSCPTINREDIPDPDDPNITQRDVAVLTVDAIRVAEHCHRDLMTTIKIIDDHNKTARELGSIKEKAR